MTYFTFRPGPAGVVEDDLVRGVHPMVGRRLNLWRLRDFRVSRLEAPEDVLLYHCVAPDNESDQRLVALAQVRELAIVRDEDGHIVSLPQAERAILHCLEAIRQARTARGAAGAKLDMNHVFVHIWPVVDAPPEELAGLQRALAPLTVGAGIEEVAVQGRIVAPDGSVHPASVRFSYSAGSGVVASFGGAPTERLAPVDDYAQKVLRARRRGTTYPYELLSLLAGPAGTFAEHDLDDTGALVPVTRPPGRNKAGLVVGVATSYPPRHPEGITRVVLLGDPTKALGAVAEAECVRVVAALDLAESMSVPVEWFALSAGARISMDSGTENMDWVARALRRIVTFTQAGGEINVVVAGINVGAQPYWNAEATMLMHTKGILVMTPDSAMVLTGKQSLDFSGGVSAEDNFGIGGYDRVMGPNGQAQYWAPGPRRCLRGAGRALRPQLPRPRRTRRPAHRHDRPRRPRRPRVPARRGGERLQHRRRHLLVDDEPGPEEGLRHPDADARRHRPGPPAARAVGRDGRRRDLGRLRRPPRRLARRHGRHRVPPGAAAWLPAQRRPRHLDGRHAVPRVVEEDREGDQRGQRQPAAWWCWRTSPASTAHRTRCATSSWSTAPRSAAPS